MDCIENIAKYILYLFNLVFLICGILLIILGSLMLSEMHEILSFDEAMHTETIPIIILVLGCIIFIVSFLGCCGAIRENVLCTNLYVICMFILMCLQIALVVWIFVKRTEFLSAMNKIVETAWNEYDTTNKLPMNSIQIAFKCCGLNSYSDYGGNVPSSCCGKLDQDLACSSTIYQSRPACQSTFYNFWDKNMDIIRWGGIAVIIIEFIAMVFAGCVIAGIRRSGGQNF